MTTSAAALWLLLEACAIAVTYPALAIVAVRRAAPSPIVLARLAAVLAAHAAVGVIVWSVAGGPTDGGGLVAARILFASLAVLAWGLGAALGRTRLEPGLAAAVSAAVALAVVAGPAIGETLAHAGVSPPTTRSLGYAISPPYAASLALGFDVLHAPGLYGLAPAAQLEMHMTTWIWTAGGLALAGSLLTFVAMAGRRRRGQALATALALVVGVAACGKKKEDASKKAPPTTPAPTTPGATPTTPPPPPAPTGPAASADEAINRGVDALVKGRDAKGLIGGHPGTTAMAAMAMAAAGVGKDDPRLKPTLDFLASLAKPDGSIAEKEYPVYVTAMSTLAFRDAGAYPELVAKAQAWLADKQFAEKNKIDQKDVNYGGIGYGTDVTEPHADLSNLEFALDAIKDSQLTDKAEVMKRAQKFIERCQNRTESNDQKWAANDGGFVYEPGSSKAGGTTSMGSMTYAGIASFLYTGADAKDPRVAAAMDYISKHWTVDENPGLGQKGLYFHLHMMGRALGLMGQKMITDAEGRQHDWADELTKKLIGLQRPDGTWVNADGTYWESNPQMATSRAVLALAHARAASK